MSAVVEKELPENWVVGKIQDLITIRNGYAFKSKDFKDNEGVPVIRQTNLSTEIVNFTKPKYLPLAFLSEHSDFKVVKGDVLIGLSGSIGNLSRYIEEEPALQNQRTGLLIEQVPGSTTFVQYYLQLIKKDLLSAAKGVAVQNISSKIIENWEIPIAPLEQQKRIVAKIEELFSHIDAGIEALNKAKQLLKQYRQSVLKAAVTGELTKEWREQNKSTLEPASHLLERILQERRQKWEEQQLEQFKAKGKIPKNDKWKEKYKEPASPDETGTHDLPNSWCWGTFEQVSERVTVGHVGSMKNEYIEKGVPFLRSQNVRENRYDSKGLKFVSEAFHEKLQKSSLEPGDLVTVRSGSVGVTCVIPAFLKKANCSDLVIVKQPKAANSKYAAYYMNTITQTKVAAEKVGVALTHFNTKSMAEMPLPLPPMIEQEMIAELVDLKVSDIENLDTVIDSQLKKAKKNKQSILASAFSGGLVDALDSDGSAKELIASIEDARFKIIDEKPVRKRSQKKSREKFVKRLLLDVLKEKGEMTVSSLMQEAGYKPDEIETFYDELSGVSDSIVELRPKGNKAKSWPYDDEVKLKLK